MNLSSWEFLRRLVRSHLAHVLLAVSWCFILFVMVRNPIYGPWFARCVPTGDEFHLLVHVVYPFWESALFVAHLPAMLVTLGVASFIQGVFALSCGRIAKLELGILFVFSTVQWLLVGYGIESLGRRMKSRKNKKSSFGDEVSTATR